MIARFSQVLPDSLVTGEIAKTEMFVLSSARNHLIFFLSVFQKDFLCMRKDPVKSLKHALISTVEKDT